MCTDRLHVFGHYVFIELVYGFSFTFRQQRLPFVRLLTDLGMIKGAQAVLHHARLTVWQQRWAVINDDSWQWPSDLKFLLTKPYWFRTGLQNVHAASNSCTVFMFFLGFFQIQFMVDQEVVYRSRTRQNFELVHINEPVQNFGPPALNFGPLRAEFAWREWRKMLGGHVANWAGLSVFSPQENKITRTFFIDCINKHFKVSNAHNSDDCHGVFNGRMLNKGWSFSRSRFDCLGLMHFFHG